MKEAERFFRKYFPRGSMTVDNGEVVFHTGTQVVGGELEPLDEDEPVKEKQPFPRYKD
jgi:hypothetical protein